MELINIAKGGVCSARRCVVAPLFDATFFIETFTIEIRALLPFPSKANHRPLYRLQMSMHE